MAPSPTGVTSSATSCTWPRSLPHCKMPTTHTRSPCTARLRRAWLAGTLTSIWAARSRRVKKTHPPRDTVGRYTSPSTATRPTRLRARAISPARRTSVTCRAAPRAGSSHSFMLI